MPSLAPDLTTTLAMIATAMRVARDNWWIIGSAAVALHGCQTSVADVDVLTSESDARGIATTLGLPSAPGTPSDRFRSRIFATWTAPPLPVEFMGGLALHDGRAWIDVELSTRMPATIDGQTIYLPDRAGLAALLHRFGRPKDLARARLLTFPRNGGEAG